MLETVGMESWDIDLLREKDCVAAVMDHVRELDRYRTARLGALLLIEHLRETTINGLKQLRGLIDQQDRPEESCNDHE
jgi:hypothetical protein